MSPVRLFLFVALASLPAGCGPGQGAIDVTVDATGIVSDVDHLLVTVSVGGVNSLPLTVRMEDAPATIPPRRSFQLRFSKDHHGAATVTVEARDKGEIVLATAAGTADLEPSHESPLALTLPGSVPPPDGGSPDLTSPDLSMPDFMPPPDLAPPPLVWSQQDGHTFLPLNAIWGSGPLDVWAVGGANMQATIVHSDNGGQTWTDLTGTLKNNELHGIWGTGPDDVFVGGWAIYHSGDGGSTWKTSMTSSQGLRTFGPIVGTLSGDLYALSGSVFNGDDVFRSTDHGATWQSIESSSGLMAPGAPNFTAALSLGASDVFVVLTNGAVLYSNDAGTDWQTQTSGSAGSLHGGWGTTTSDVYIVGDGGFVAHSTNAGGAWSQATAVTTQNLYSVWGSSTADVYAVGAAGTILHSSDAGVHWTVEATPTTQALRAIWGNGSRDVYVVGDDGTILHGQ